MKYDKNNEIIEIFGYSLEELNSIIAFAKVTGYDESIKRVKVSKHDEPCPDCTDAPEPVTTADRALYLLQANCLTPDDREVSWRYIRLILTGNNDNAIRAQLRADLSKANEVINMWYKITLMIISLLFMIIFDIKEHTILWLISIIVCAFSAASIMNSYTSLDEEEGDWPGYK